MSVDPRSPRSRPAQANLDQEKARARETRVFVTEASYYDERAAGLVSAWAAGVPHALAQIREWHPAFANASDDDIRQAPFDLDAARVVYARQHGVADWPALLAHVRAIAAGERTEPFHDAFEALQHQDWPRLTTVMERHPEVLRVRGTNGNTLLNLAICLAGRSCDALPPEALSLVERFLAAGADVHQANDRGWTPLHQAADANHVPLATRLIAAGAAVDREAHGAGGTPLAVAAFWGHREVSDVLAAVAVVPPNVRMAAALGRVDLVEASFTADGTLTAAARAERGFYRPHSGFPVWRPADDSQEVLNEALVWAAKADRVEVMPTLVARGADVNGDPYRGTPLIWAAWNARVAAVRWLLDHGAEVNRRATFGGLSHGEGVTALHLAAQRDHVEMVRLLMERSADPTLEDALHHGTPASWAAHFGATRAQALLVSADRSA